MEAYVVDVSDLSMVHLQIQYDPLKLSLLSVNSGDFFQTSNPPLIVFNNNSNNGLIDIYMSFLDSELLSVNGTGNIANILFNTIRSGVTTVSFTSNSQFLTLDEKNIEIKYFDEGTINVN